MPDQNLTAARQRRTREQVTAAREQVGRMRSLPDMSSKQQDEVDTAYSLLVDLEDRLVQQDLKSSLRELKETAEKLSGIASGLRNSINGLERIAQVVGGAAKAVGALAEILAKTSSAGLL